MREGGKGGKPRGSERDFYPFPALLSLSPDSNQELPHVGGWVAVAVEGGGDKATRDSRGEGRKE